MQGDRFSFFNILIYGGMLFISGGIFLLGILLLAALIYAYLRYGQWQPASLLVLIQNFGWLNSNDWVGVKGILDLLPLWLVGIIGGGYFSLVVLDEWQSIPRKHDDF